MTRKPLAKQRDGKKVISCRPTDPPTDQWSPPIQTDCWDIYPPSGFWLGARSGDGAKVLCENGVSWTRTGTAGRNAPPPRAPGSPPHNTRTAGRPPATLERTVWPPAHSRSTSTVQGGGRLPHRSQGFMGSMIGTPKATISECGRPDRASEPGAWVGSRRSGRGGCPLGGRRGGGGGRGGRRTGAGWSRGGAAAARSPRRRR